MSEGIVLAISRESVVHQNTRGLARPSRNTDT